MAATFNCPTFSISADDIESLHDIVLLRLADSRLEERRMIRLRALLRSATELTGALSVYTRHALVACSGTPGTADLAADGHALRVALERYSALVREVTLEFGPFVPRSQSVAFQLEDRE